MSDFLTEPLPLILLGPILRRSEEKQVCVWLACSKPVSIRITVLRFDDLTKGQAKPLGSGIAKSIQLGRHLHVALVVARPIAINDLDKFPTDELLAYDIEVADDSGKTTTLKDSGLLSGANSIVYSGNGASLPTFFLAGKDIPLNLLHGSCRKLHGKGEDCLFAADEVIASSFADLKRRPSALFLTGDQVYADDVAKPLANYVTQLGIKLLGWEEQVRGVNRKLSQIKPGDRQKVIKEFARFTAGHAGNHLLGFGEFVAMYMVAWNAENWPVDLSNARKMPFGERRKYIRHIKQLEETRRDLATVRRVLANTPTYMIFDDHEITDDWNITREWHDNVADSECGKQIITNGLAAYWAFQGWGNDPSLYNDHFIGKIVEYFGKRGNLPESEIQEFEDFLWNFHGWSFSAPSNPLTIFVDCRTQRQYDTFKGPPQIVGEEALLSISRIAEDSNFKKGDPLIVVVPTPVLGFYLIEVLQKLLAMIISVYAVDLESWFANTVGRIRFLTFLLQTLAPKHCIFLSGDVHFGFTIKAAFAPLQEGYGHDDIISITQLNSSALKTTSLVKIAFVSEILGRIRQIFPFKRLVRTGRLDRLRSLVGRRHPDWVEARTIVSASGSILPPLLISDNNIGYVTIERDLSRIVHKFLVRKATKETRIYETIVRTDGGRSPLEDNVNARISKYVVKQS